MQNKNEIEKVIKTTIVFLFKCLLIYLHNRTWMYIVLLKSSSQKLHFAMAYG